MGRTDQEDGDPRRRVETEAADWWSRLELGTADRDAFERWRDADAAHAIAFARVQANWEALADHAPALAAARRDDRAVTRRRFLRAGGLAACVIAGGTFYTSRAMAWDRARTGVGEFRRIALPDASMLELNTDTEVSWHFTRQARKIRLEHGEIAMALTAGAPATLLAEDARLVLSPGRFNARLVGRTMGLTVLRGHAVAQRGPGVATVAQTALKSGEAAEFTPTGLTVQPTTVESQALITAWQSGDIAFENASLQDAVDEYNRYLTVKIAVDPSLRAQRVGGRFTTSDPSAFLQAVALSLDADVRTVPGEIRISAKK